MVYEVYKQKVEKIARVFRFVKKHSVLFSLALIAVVGSLVALGVTKGMVGDLTCNAEFVYGDKLNCKADAFLADVQFEFKADDGSWERSVPSMPGKYSVRAVAKSILGSDRYSNEKEFTIVAKEITVSVLEDKLVYGEKPTVAASLVGKDRIQCTGFVYENILNKSTQVYAEDNKIKIFNGINEDVTSAYDIRIEMKSVEILPRELSVTVADSSKVYDGIRFAYDQYEISGGTLAKDDVLQATFTAELTDVGSVLNQPSLQILNKKGYDVTHHYNIHKSFGNLTVEKRPLVVASESTSLTYDGKEHTLDIANISKDTPLVDGHMMQIDEATTVKNAGRHENLLKLSIFDEDGVSKTENYSVFVEKGTIEILPKDISVLSSSNSWMYDGESHWEWNADVTGILEDHTVTKLFTNTIINYGSVENKVAIMVLDENSENVTGNYRIDYKFGTLSITKRPIVFQPKSASKTYDAEPLYSYGYNIISKYGLADGDYFFDIKSTAITEAGKQLNVFEEYRILNRKDEDVTDNYEIQQKSDLYLTVYKRPVVLKPKDVSAYYCAETILADEVQYSPGNQYQLVNGHSIQAEFFGQSFYVTPNPIITKIKSVKILNENSDDVTVNYDIELETGVLNIMPRPITIRVIDTQKIYDGTPLKAVDCYEVLPVTPLEEALVKEDVIASITLIGEQTDVGSVEAEYGHCTIKDGNGKTITENYEILFQSGILTVIPRPITVMSGSAEKIYDGKPLTCHDPIEIISGSLVLDHVLDMEAVGTITEVGKVPNDIEGSVKTSKNKDVSHNYEITKALGTLTVYYDSSGGIDDGSGSGSGGGSGGDLSTSGSLTESKNESSNQTVLRIKSDQTSRIYLKLMSFGNYTGVSWNQAIEYPNTIGGKYSMNYLPGIVLENANLTQSTLLVQSFTNQYFLPYHLALNDIGYDVQSSDIAYVGSGASEYSIPYFVYSGLCTEYRGLLGPYSKDELAYRKFVYDNYLTVDSATRSYMKSLIKENGFSASDPDIYDKVAMFVKTAAKYNLEYDAALDNEANIAVAFLSKYKEGVCVHYASAATLIFRSLGIPARYVVGYMGTTVADQWAEISSPGHAWTEVYIDGIGWIPLEVTGGDGVGNGEPIPDPQKPTLQISPAFQSKVYDGDPLYAKNELEGSVELSKLLEMGYRYEVEVEGERTDVGLGESNIKSFTLYDPSGNDVTSEYNIICRKGTLEVLVSQTNVVKVYLYRLQKYYDGAPLQYTDDDYWVKEIAPGLKLELKLNISITNVGYLTLSDINRNISSYATYHIYKNGEDITRNCKLQFVSLDGTEDSYIPIQVDKRPIELTVNSVSKVHDGNPLMGSNISVTKGSLAEGDSISHFSLTGSIISVGSTECYIVPNSVQIVDLNGFNVTSNYEITTKSGLLTVIKKPRK